MSWLESRDYDRWREDRREREYEYQMGYDKPEFGSSHDFPDLLVQPEGDE